MLYVIEICGTCNLRCPSCAVGNMDAGSLTGLRPKGFMDPDRPVAGASCRAHVVPGVIVRGDQ
ncbi:hypothetical protein [Austwickia chelonae]|uniref:hypothetical protein n=1 Tax=Austwickia chelonae TaxID=100225 RepID=UPI000E28752A|nr:hypothetical protein [Austwickia chelonae]